MIVFYNNKKYNEKVYSREEDLEADVVSNSKVFFGKDSIYIDAKRKIDSKLLGGTIPDGFLFDLSDKENPEFFLVEIELSKHDFFTHIFPQITKFFAFFKNSTSRTDLVERLFSTVNNDRELRSEFKKYLGDKEIYKFIKDTIDNSQNILLMIDEDKEELPEIKETYTDTWGKIVKLLVLKKFILGEDFIYTLNPSFENIEFADAESVEKAEVVEKMEFTEEFHLEDVSEQVKRIYLKIKESLLKFNESLIFNPRKFYISIVYKRNVAFFQFRRKKIRLVVMLPEEEVRAKIKSHAIKHLLESVQKFWNGPSCAISIDSEENIEEIINLLKTLVKKE